MSVRTEPTTTEEPKRFIFKSKFREDKITLRKPQTELNPDGTKSVHGHVMAEFNRNTWSTDDPQMAEAMRTAIHNRLKRGVPIEIVETTVLEGPGQKAKKGK